MARKKTVTLKLSKEDHDLLIPDLDRNIEILRRLTKIVEEEKLPEEENIKAEEIEKKYGRDLIDDFARLRGTIQAVVNSLMYENEDN